MTNDKIPTEITVSVKVSDGSFDASLTFPVSSSPKQIEAVVKAWMNALQQAVELCKAPTQ